MRKGVAGIEFVVAVSLFLIGFWLVYTESAVMLTPNPQHSDARQPAIEYYSNVLLHDPGSPKDWTWSPSEFGLAYYENDETFYNILDYNKLEWMADRDCDWLWVNQVTGMRFAVEVLSKRKTWSCSTDIKKEAFVERPVYIRIANHSYDPGVLRVWGV
jgi:hypothetical protein